MKPNNAKYIKRLEQLIRVLRGLSRHERNKHFYMGTWGSETDCGTTMCAAGFAGSDSWFRKRGFKFYKDRSGLYGIKYKKGYGWTAIDDFFFGYDTWAAALTDPNHTYPDPDESEKIFRVPTSVTEVIRAARARIKTLQQDKP